jgi:hypothetical protein
VNRSVTIYDALGRYAVYATDGPVVTNRPLRGTGPRRSGGPYLIGPLARTRNIPHFFVPNYRQPQGRALTVLEAAGRRASDAQHP